MNRQFYLFFLLFNLFYGFAFSQKKSLCLLISGKTPVGFESEIIEFLKQDSVSFPPADAYLFTGSSTIRKWDYRIRFAACQQ